MERKDLYPGRDVWLAAKGSLSGPLCRCKKVKVLDEAEFLEKYPGAKEMFLEGEFALVNDGEKPICIVSTSLLFSTEKECQDYVSSL